MSVEKPMLSVNQVIQYVVLIGGLMTSYFMGRAEIEKEVAVMKAEFAAEKAYTVRLDAAIQVLQKDIKTSNNEILVKIEQLRKESYERDIKVLQK